MNDTTFQGDGEIVFVPVVVNSKQHKQTNGDKIRSMTDEELADLLTGVAKKSAEMLCKSLKTVEVDLSKCDFEILTKSHLSWLKATVEEGEG